MGGRQGARAIVEAWKVHKFGGSSVADAACMQRVARIIEDDLAPRKAVVLSACRGVTDALLGLIAMAERQDPALDDRIEELRQRHLGLARELLTGELCDEFIVELDRDCRDIGGILQTVRLVRAASTTMRDLIAGYGEIWSTRIFERLLRSRGQSTGQVLWVDARRVLLGRVGAARPRGALGPVARESARAGAVRLRRHGRDHRLHRHATPTGCRPRSAATAATSRPRFSARCSPRAKSSSGPTSTAC